MFLYCFGYIYSFIHFTKEAYTFTYNAILVSERDKNELTNNTQTQILAIELFLKRWGLTINTEKTLALTTTMTTEEPPPIKTIDNKPIIYSDEIKYLGITINKTLTFGPRLKNVHTRAIQRLCQLYPLLSANIPADYKRLLYKTYLTCNDLRLPSVVDGSHLPLKFS